MIGRALLASLLAVHLAAAPAARAEAPEQCRPDPGVVKLPAGEPWAQRRLGIKDVWSLTRGAGVKVAVIDSGLDYKHPQIRFSSFVDVTGTGYRDCVGHGTAIAGIVGGRPYPGVPFHGVAPEAEIVVIKQSEQERGKISDLVEGINRAVERDVDVINVSMKAVDHPELRAAVEAALAADIVVVAAAGNIAEGDGPQTPAYPAAYEGVLAVGGATPQGTRAQTSSTTTPVSLIAPGEQITAPWPGRAYQVDLVGTSFAAPYVAGVAALVRARFPELGQQQVRQRLIATADGPAGEGTGAGMVNPRMALTAVLPFEAADAPVVAPPPPPPLPAGAIAKAPEPDHRAREIALTVTWSVLGLAVLGAAVGFVVPLGRRRGWRPGKAS